MGLPRNYTGVGLSTRMVRAVASFDVVLGTSPRLLAGAPRRRLVAFGSSLRPGGARRKNDRKRSPGVRWAGVLYAASATFETLASGRSEGAAVPLSLASTVRVT